MTPRLREIIKKGREGMPIFGTCAGMILLANKVLGIEQIRFCLMIKEVRNLNEYKGL